MTQQEFQDRTGMQVTPSFFRTINSIYMHTVMDKDDFCKDYAAHKDSLIIDQLHTNAVNYELQVEADKNAKMDVATILIGKSHAYNDPDMRTAAVMLVGEKAVVDKTLEMDLPLWDDDKRFIRLMLNK